MIALTDYDFDQMTFIEGATLLSIAIEARTSKHWINGRLEILSREAMERLADVTDPYDRLTAFIHLFYKEWKFKGDFEQYFSSENAFIEKVLRRKKGIPMSLGAIFIHIANRLDLPVKPVSFPTQLIMRIDWKNRPTDFIDPFDGKFLSQRMMRGWLIGKEGSQTEVLPEHLEIAPNHVLIERWLNVMKNALLREEDFVKALRCTEISLLMTPDDPYEIRDRGYIFQQLDCDWVAADDYEYFITQCPDDPAAELLKLQVKVLTEQSPVFH